MKKTVQREETICDICLDDEAYAGDMCLICGKDLCDSCHRELPSHFYGDSGVDYCPDCFDKLESGELKDPLYDAAIKMREAQAKHKALEAKMKRRQDRMDRELEQLLRTTKRRVKIRNNIKKMGNQ